MVGAVTVCAAVGGGHHQAVEQVELRPGKELQLEPPGDVVHIYGCFRSLERDGHVFTALSSSPFVLSHAYKTPPTSLNRCRNRDSETLPRIRRSS